MESSRIRVLFILLLVGLIGLTFFLDSQRRHAEAELKQLTVRMEQLQTGGGEQNQEVARQIVARLRRHIDIPTDIEPTVATIVDVNKLREKNSFYDKAENGDYLVVTNTRAILYNAQKDAIIDVIPVQIRPQDAPADDAAQQVSSEAPAPAPAQ